MNDLSAVADELSALVRDGRAIRLGDRDFAKPHMELDALLARLEIAAGLVRLYGIALPAPVITGRGQLLVSVARPVPGRHVGPPAPSGPAPTRRVLHVVSGPGDAA
ncbi:MAG: hypothetical protein WAP03_25480 [Methylorubrum rhodinum]|uniref:hypothetical protein n=1 Tax=Methylorubrum rhodinum TaxID=29428 RepID=UPI003BAE8CF2